MCLNFKTGSKEPGTPRDYCKAWTASMRVRTQGPGSAIADSRPASGYFTLRHKQLLHGLHQPFGHTVLRHHSHDKVRFGNELILRNALVFTLRFNMSFRVVGY